MPKVNQQHKFFAAKQNKFLNFAKNIQKYATAAEARNFMHTSE
jgi:hypothetical protein